MSISKSLAGFALLAMVVAGATERFDYVVRNKFFAGFAGDREALAEAMKVCEAVLAENANHAEARVWYGSGQMVQSRELMRTDPAKGMELYSAGLKNMDRAVEIAPDDVGVRAPRAAVIQAVSHFVPEQQKSVLLARVIADYQHVFDIQQAYWDKLGTHPKGELLFGLADAYSRTGENEKAAVYFEKLQAELQGSVYAKRAATWLQTRTPLPAAETRCVGCHTAK